MNQITEIHIRLDNTDPNHYTVEVVKEFGADYGGGTQTFSEDGGNTLHRALDVARGMVTLSPAFRTDLDDYSHLARRSADEPLRGESPQSTCFYCGSHKAPVRNENPLSNHMNALRCVDCGGSGTRAEFYGLECYAVLEHSGGGDC